MSNLALQLIAENKSSKATFLDLGNCELNEIPTEIGDLVWLKHLALGSEWFEWDGENWQTKNSRNIGPQNRLADLAPLAHLTGLQLLVLSDTPVSDLAPLAHLSHDLSKINTNFDVHCLARCGNRHFRAECGDRRYLLAIAKYGRGFRQTWELRVATSSTTPALFVRG